MATIASLIVRIGADKSQLDAVLAKAGESAKNLDASLKKLGNTPIGQEAQKSAEALSATLKQVTDRQQTLAERSRLAAAGIESLGGPAKLTREQLDQLNKTIQKGLDAFRALGQDVPPQLQKVADAVKAQQQALAQTGEKTSALGGLFGELAKKAAALAGPAAIGFAVKSTFEFADTLTKMSDRTGVGVEALQRLGNIARPSGNSIEDLAGSINKFQKNLADGNAEATEAIKRIGLSVTQLKALSPDEQFIAIAKGIQTIKDPAEQTLVAMQLFGKGGAEILPSLKAKVDELKDSATVMSEESVKALDDLGDEFESLKISALNSLGSIIAGIANFKRDIKDLPGTIESALKTGQVRPQGSVAAADFVTGGLASELLAREQRQLEALRPTLPGVDRPLSASSAPGVPANAEQISAGLTASAQALLRIQQQQLETATRLGLSLEDYQKQLESVSTKIRVLSTDTGSLTQAEAARAAQLNALGLSENEIAISLGRSSRAVHDYFDNVKAGAAAEVAFLKELDAQNKLEVDAERATIKLSLALREHLLPNTKSLKDAVAGLGTEFVRFDGQNEAVALHLSRSNDNLLTLGTRVNFSKLQVSDFDTRITALSKSLTQLAVVSSGAFGEIVRGFAGVITSVDAVKKSFDSLSSGGFLNKLTGLTGIIGAGVGIVTAIGEAISGLFSTPEWQRAMDEVSRDWGVAISRGTAEGIEATERELAKAAGRRRTLGGFSGQQQFRFAAELLNLNQIISDAGGLTDNNLEKFEGRLHDVFSALARGELNASQAAQILDDNFQAFVDAATSKVGLLDQRMVGIIQLTRQAGVESKQIASFVQAQVTGNIFGGLSRFAQSGQVTTQGSASALGSALGAGIAELQRQGTPLTEILKQVTPIVKNLEAQFAKAGVSGGEAFDQIKAAVALASDEIGGPAIDAVGGLGEVLKGLSNTGLLTQQQFTGLSDQVVETFQNLVAQGKDGDTALRLMQPTLQTIFELQEKFGFVVDEGTQALLDQAEAQGIVGDKFKSTQQQTVDALKKTNDILTAIAKALGATIPQAAEDAAEGVTNALKKIQIPTLHIPIEVDPAAAHFNDYGATGGRVMPWGIQQFASGGRVLPFWPRGTDTVAAMLTPGEVVLNAAQQKNLSDRLSGGSITIQAEMPVYLDGQRIATNTVKRIIEDKRGTGTALKNYFKGVA